MIKKALKAFAVFNIVSWYLYGMSDGMLKYTESCDAEKKAREKGDKVEVVFEPVIIGAFRNFKKVFKWMIG